MSKPTITVNELGRPVMSALTFSAKKDDVHCLRISTSSPEYLKFVSDNLTEDETERGIRTWNADTAKKTSTYESVITLVNEWFDIKEDLLTGGTKDLSGKDNYNTTIDFHYTCEAHKKSAPVAAFKEELAAYVFHPDRVARFSEKYGWGDPLTGSAGWMEMV